MHEIQDLPDVQGDLLCGFLTRLAVIGPAEQNIAGRLIDSALGYAARRHTTRTNRPRPTSLGTHDDADASRPVRYRTGAAEKALYQAATHLADTGTLLAPADLKLIARTRLDHETLITVAADLGLSTEAAYKRRQRAERHNARRATA